MIEAIALNPKKSSRWNTKGINLSLKQPVAMVPKDLDNEFIMRIQTAIANEEIFEVDSTSLENLKLKGVGEVGQVDEAEVQHEDAVCGRQVSEPDENGQRRVESYFIAIKSD